jgi:hypothetical protein
MVLDLTIIRATAVPPSPEAPPELFTDERDDDDAEDPERPPLESRVR